MFQTYRETIEDFELDKIEKRLKTFVAFELVVYHDFYVEIVRIKEQDLQKFRDVCKNKTKDFWIEFREEIIKILVSKHTPVGQHCLHLQTPKNKIT